MSGPDASAAVTAAPPIYIASNLSQLSQDQEAQRRERWPNRDISWLDGESLATYYRSLIGLVDSFAGDTKPVPGGVVAARLEAARDDFKLDVSRRIMAAVFGSAKLPDYVVILLGLDDNPELISWLRWALQQYADVEVDIYYWADEGIGYGESWRPVAA